jgi:hypothetical protein
MTCLSYKPLDRVIDLALLDGNAKDRGQIGAAVDV